MKSDCRKCQLTNYMSCLKFSNRNSSDCSSQCIEPCNRWSYRIYGLSELTDEPFISIEFRILDYFYPLFKEEQAWTFDTVSCKLALNLLLLDFQNTTDIIPIADFRSPWAKAVKGFEYYAVKWPVKVVLLVVFILIKIWYCSRCAKQITFDALKNFVKYKMSKRFGIFNVDRVAWIALVLDELDLKDRTWFSS